MTKQLPTSQKEDWPRAAGAKAALGTVKHHSADNCYVPNFSADEKGLSLGIKYSQLYCHCRADGSAGERTRNPIMRT